MGNGMIAARALDLAARTGSDYPAPHDAPCLARIRRALGNVFGLSQFGVNLLDLPPGAWSSQRHWHEHQDEFVYVLEGEVVLVTDEGETVLTPGMTAGFHAGSGNGHHLVNRPDRTRARSRHAHRRGGRALFRHRHDGARGCQRLGLLHQGRTTPEMSFAKV